jgi:hypothetical protein
MGNSNTVRDAKTGKVIAYVKVAVSVRTHKGYACFTTDGSTSCDADGEPGGLMPAEENAMPLSKEDIYFASATGRIKIEPNEKEEIKEYSFDKLPLSAQLKWRQQKEKRYLDGRRPILSWWKTQAPVVDWEGKMGLLPKNRSGVIDPVR